MNFKTYWSSLSKDQRQALADKCGFASGHLRNVSYGDRECSAELASALELHTDGVVMRWDMRPTDWYRIWPELIVHPGAPEVPDHYKNLVSGQTSYVARPYLASNDSTAAIPAQKPI